MVEELKEGFKERCEEEERRSSLFLVKCIP
jgi:hypothetical protein